MFVFVLRSSDPLFLLHTRLLCTLSAVWCPSASSAKLCPSNVL